MIRRLMIPLAGVTAGWAVGMWWAGAARRKRLFSPAPWPEGDWNVLPPDQRQEYIVPTPDGETLHAWYLDSGGRYDPILLWFHGAGGNLTSRVPVADRLRQNGVSVFLFDWRGYGHSTGKPSAKGLMTDAFAARDFVARHFPQARPVVLYGESLGGPYAAAVAARREAASVIIENSFPSLSALAQVEYFPWPAGLLVPFSLRTADWLNDAGLPVLVMHGRKDQTVPLQLGIRLYESLRTPRALLISDAGHNEIGLVDCERYDAAVLDFVGATTLGEPDLFGTYG